MSMIDETHDPRRESWVVSARGHAEFPIQNLPFGVFSPAGGAPRGGVAIGDAIFDLEAGVVGGVVYGPAVCGAPAASGATPHPTKGLGPGPRHCPPQPRPRPSRAAH